MTNEIIPIFPVCMIFAENRTFNIKKAAHEFEKMSLYQYSKRFYNKFEIIDSELNVWHLHVNNDRYKINLLTKLLSQTIYNPRFHVNLKWEKKDKIELNILKDKLATTINNDDDILTQFISKEEMKRIINESKEANIMYNNLWKKINEE